MKIAVLLSGGVDSSVALMRLREQGHAVTAFYLKIWLEDELSFLGNCPWEEDLKFAREVCGQANVPLKVMSLQKEYWDEVVRYTIDGVKAGRTPNPDMMCNSRIKFGKFYERIPDEFEKVATGHYARVGKKGGIFYLKTSADSVKDQTYFLAHLRQDQLGRALFPIGDLTKAEVRALAKEYRLPNQDRKDSQGICFLGKIKFDEFLKHHLGERKGDLIELETGEKVGEHRGFWYYTIGQRQGIRLAGGPWFVVKKELSENRVIISKHYHEADKIRDHVEVGGLSWISGYNPPLNKPVELRVKVRHGPKFYEAEVSFNGKSGKSGNRGANIATSATVKLHGSDQGLAPGQFMVFYDGDTCLGSGIMTGMP